MTTSRLAPCPFCGHAKPFLVTAKQKIADLPTTTTVNVCCHGCNAVGPHAETEAAAVARWNESSMRAP